MLSRQEGVPWRHCEGFVAREDADDDGVEPARVHLVALEHESWVAKAWR
jgi:hypothetical protein